MKKNKNSYEVLEAEVAKLKEENRHLKDERDELKYMLNDMHSVVDAANDDFFNEMSRLCGCIEIEGTRITAAYAPLRNVRAVFSRFFGWLRDRERIRRNPMVLV